MDLLSLSSDNVNGHSCLDTLKSEFPFVRTEHTVIQADCPVRATVSSSNTMRLENRPTSETLVNDCNFAPTFDNLVYHVESLKGMLYFIYAPRAGKAIYAHKSSSMMFPTVDPPGQRSAIAAHPCLPFPLLRSLELATHPSRPRISVS